MRVMFTYWGRRGLTRLALDVARAAIADNSISATVSVSRQNENFSAFSELDSGVLTIDTFVTPVGALLNLWRVPRIRQRLLQHICEFRPQVVIELMPHVWSSLIFDAVKAAGVRYVPIIHDATPHPGDYRSASISWLRNRSLRQADVIITLSGAVAGRIASTGFVPSDKVFPLFHPDLDFGGRCAKTPPKPGEPLKLLFFGRIMRYKGLPLFLDMVEELRRRGIAVEFGVFGEGGLGTNARRLTQMGAQVINRWLNEDEIGSLLPQYHAMVLPHIQASQSGVAATALGAGLPIIATPVGGLIEQITDGVTGILAARADSWALADAAEHLLFNPTLYDGICQNIAALKSDRSVARFVKDCAYVATMCEVPTPL